MLCRGGCDLKAGIEVDALPPGDVRAVFKAFSFEPFRMPLCHEDSGIHSELSQGWQVEVVVVRVGEQDAIDGWEIFDSTGRRDLPAEARKGQWGAVIGENRVDQEIAAACLDEERGMPQPGDAASSLRCVCDMRDI